MLFTAIAATAVVLPMAIYGIPGVGDDKESSPAAPHLTQQPLTDLSGGETIREIHQDTPFSLVALTADDLSGTSARIRAKKPDGTWGPWYEAEAMDMAGPDIPVAGAPHGTEPIFVGRTNTVQIAVNRPAPVGPTRADDRPPLGYIPANVEAPLPQNVNAVLISPPEAPVDSLPRPSAVTAPGVPPQIIDRAGWGADEAMRCPNPQYDRVIRAGIVHHTAGSNDYAPQDSAGIIRSIYAYHTLTLGWCDIAYNALVDKYGQVFEGRAGGITRPVEGAHTGGFNRDTWGVAMLGNFDQAEPTQIQLENTGRLLGWRLGLDHIDPKGTVVLASAGTSFSKFPFGATPALPTIFTHRDVGITECPGNAAYAAMGQIRDIAARFNRPVGPADLADTLRGGAIFLRWESMGGPNSPLGAPRSPEASGEGPVRYANFEHGAIYWSPTSGAQPVTGEIYKAWGSLGFERGALGLPTSGEIQEPLWIVQNFQHGTLNFDRETGTVTRVIDQVATELPKSVSDNTPIQLERFTPPISSA
jgi:uncharacterized protein with LGFP repeats